MSLTLGNNLTGLVSRQVDSDGRKARGLGESMTTGNNKFVSVVDAFLGSSLRDNEVILGAVAKNTAYSVNMLSIADEYMSSMSTALQGALTASSSAGQVSADKIPTLQASLNDKITQLKLLIKTADFDNKALFSGGVKDLGVQVGLNSSDKLIVNIKDISGGKILRSSVTAALNKHIAANAANTAYYAQGAGVGAALLATDKANNTNLAMTAITDGANFMTDVQFGAALHAVIVAKPSFGTFLNDALPTSKDALPANVTFVEADAVQLTTLLARDTDADAAVRITAIVVNVPDDAANDAATTATNVSALIQALPANQASAAVKAAAAAAAVGGFADHNAARTAVRLAAIRADAVTAISHAVAPRPSINVDNGAVAIVVQVINANAAATAILALPEGVVSQRVKDAATAAAVAPGATANTVRDAALNCTGNRVEMLDLLSDNAPTNLTKPAGRAIAQDVIQNSLSYIRQEQSSISNQKGNIVETTDALRATTNVTQQAADSYLKADYVLTAQEYSEILRTMVAAITALQAANKIPEAAQRLLDALTR